MSRRRRPLIVPTLTVLVLVAGVIVLAVQLLDSGPQPRRAGGGRGPGAPAPAGGGGRTNARGAANRPTTGKRPAPHRSTTVQPVPARAGAGGSSMSLARQVGQLIVGRFSGREPSRAFLGRVRAGQLGGVILFADNTGAGLAQTRATVAALQSAARAGGNPPLLVMTDQEGGEVKRLPGPPTLAPDEMTARGVAEAQGRTAGRLLRSAGIDVDLAPVADVERAPESFLGTRAFGSSAPLVAQAACAFAQGLSQAGIAYTLKHFPGLGRAQASTDVTTVSVSATPAQLRADYGAYRHCGSDPHALIMISSAIYPQLSGPRPAVMSPEIYRDELHAATGTSAPLTISDDLQTPGVVAQAEPARHALDAGLDLALYATSESGSRDAYRTLVGDADRGLLPRARIRAAVARIQALKRLLGHMRRPR